MSRKVGLKSNSLPDPLWPRNQLRAGGDLRSAVRSASEYILRSAAFAVPGSKTPGIRFAYYPDSLDGDPRGRLSLHLFGAAHGAGNEVSVELLLDATPLSDFYGLEPLVYDMNGVSILRWYGVKLERNPGCPVCGDFETQTLKAEGLPPSEGADESEAMVGGTP